MTNWIRIEDEEPTQEYVLIVNEDGDMCVGSYEIKDLGGCWRIGHDKHSWDYDFNLDFYVTHWQELPVKP
jgi:hypothetical protein